MLVVDRAESRPGERLTLALTKPFQCLAPKLLTIPIETLAKSIIANTIFKQDGQKPVEIVENTKIFDLAKMYENES